MRFEVVFAVFAFLVVTTGRAVEHKDSIGKYLDFNYFGVFEGPSVSNPTRYLPDKNGDGDIDRPIILTNYITTAYNLNPDLSLGVLATIEVFPFEDIIVNGLDPAIRLTHYGLFKSDSFKTLFDLRIYLPVTEVSKEAEMTTVIQSLQMVEYRFEKSRFSLGSISMFEVGFFGAKGEDVKDFSLSLAPNLNYYLTDETSLNLFVGASLNHYKNRQEKAAFIEDDYVGPGVTFSVGDSFSISPVLTLPPRNPMLKNLSVLAFVYFKLE